MRFPRGGKSQIPFRLRSQRAIKYRSRRGSGSRFNAVLIISESGSIRSLQEHVVAPNAAGGTPLETKARYDTRSLCAEIQEEMQSRRGQFHAS